jgi:hypothetical protein
MNLLLIDRTLNDASMENMKDVVDPGKTHLLVVDLADPTFSVLDQLGTLPANKYTSVGIVVYGSNIIDWSVTLLEKSFAQILQSICINATEEVVPSVDIFAWGLTLGDASIVSLSQSLQKGMAVFITNKQTGDWYLEHCYHAGQLLTRNGLLLTTDESEPAQSVLPSNIMAFVDPNAGLDLRLKYLDIAVLETKGKFVFS